MSTSPSRRAAAKSLALAAACENSMRGYSLTRAQLNPHISTVPSGVGHLIRRQNEGYAYIRSRSVVATRTRVRDTYSCQ